MKRNQTRRRRPELIEPLESRTLLAVDFSLATFSDTQYTVESFPQTFKTQTAWIAAHKADSNYKVAFFTHQGDMLRRGYSDFQAQNAADALANLDAARVPYAVAIGNHDYDNQFDDLDRHVSSANFTRWFGNARYAPQVAAGEISEYGSSPDQRNHYHVFSITRASGTTQKFLVLSLEWQVPTAAQQWGQSVINAHKNLPVILSTHEYLAGSANSRSSGTPVDAAQIGAQNGTSLWSNFVTKNNQIFLVLSGHTGATWNRTVNNSFGNTVIEAAADFEGAQPNGGDGWMQTLTFDLGDGSRKNPGSVKITSLRPTSSTTQTLGASTTYSINFTQRFALGAAPAPVTPPANAAPVAPDLALSTRESTALTFNPLTSASDADADALKALPTTLPPRGALYVNDNGTFTYTPDPKFVGSESFTYVVSDGKNTSAPVTVSVTVQSAPPVYSYPTAESTVAGTRTGSLANLQVSDNVVESVKEVISSGADVDQRYTFTNVLGGGADKVLALNAWRSFTNPGTGDEYHPQYSTDNATWSDLTPIVYRGSKDVTRTRFEANEPYQLWSLPASLSGTLYVRLTDVNTSGTETADTLTVDEIFIRALDTQAPDAPANLAVTATTDSSVSLAWNAPADNVAVAAYDVYRDGALIGSTPQTTYTDASATAAAYTYTVIARDAAGNTSAASNPATVAWAPSAATNLQTTAVSSTGSEVLDSAQLDWTDTSTRETGFRIYISDAPDGIFTLLASTAANTTTFATQPLQPGTWYFKVVGTNDNGDSPDSNIASVLI
jgi:chitodextrinase